MSEASPPSPDLLRQVLDVYRRPLLHRPLWADPRRPLPEGVADLLDLALAPRAALAGHAARLRAGPDELAAAIHFFIHQALLAEGGDAYRVLGLTPAATPGQIKSHYLKLMRLYHPDRPMGREWGGIYAPRINHAYSLLRAGRPAPNGHQPPPWRHAFDREAPRPAAFGPVARPARRQPSPRQWGFAAIGVAAAAGAGLIAWNLSTWPELPAPPRPPSAARQAPPTRTAEAAAPTWPEPAPPPAVKQRPPAWPAPRLDKAPRPAAVPAPKPPPAAEAAAAEPGGLDEDELNRQVLGRLAAAYRQGDLAGLMSLFSEHAVTGDQPDREGIRDEYARFFANTTRRELRLDNFRWQIDGQTAIGKGTFNLKVSTTEPNARPSYEGTLILDVGQGPKGPLINGLFQSPGESP